MLNFLEIQNIAIIDKIHVEFGEGLNVITGETGAGKSIIINSINAILGERMSKAAIRTGEDLAKVTAVFNTTSSKAKEVLDELGIPEEEDGTLIIEREIHSSGRNVCRINCKVVTLTVLRRIGEYIINIHGQNDNRDLIEVGRHIGLLDLYIGERMTQLKTLYRKKLNELRHARESLVSRVGNREERERKIDLLKYQLEEIERANLEVGEDDELLKKKNIAANTERIKVTLCTAEDVLCRDGGVRDLMNAVVGSMSQIADLDKRYGEISDKINDLAYQLDDVADDIRNNLDNLDLDEGELEWLNDRLDLIMGLKRKYGSSIEDVLEYMDKCSRDLDELMNSEEYIERAREEIAALNEELLDVARKMHALRVVSAKELQERVTNELRELEMRDSKFSVRVNMSEGTDADGVYAYGSNGLDKVEFFISTNKGEKEKPLTKIASGGEMSRVMLAIKEIILDKDNLESIVFDEIDTGISGRAAQKVGEKLARLGTIHQVICITHLPQIATMGDNHYMIEKTSSREVTTTTVRELGAEDRTKEVARIIGGATISDITMSNAREMIRLADEWKNNQCGCVQ